MINLEGTNQKKKRKEKCGKAGCLKRLKRRGAEPSGRVINQLENFIARFKVDEHKQTCSALEVA